MLCKRLMCSAATFRPTFGTGTAKMPRRAERVELTPQLLRGAAQPGRLVILWDSLVVGLGARVSEHGTVTLFVRAYAPGGGDFKATVGRWNGGGAASLTEARRRSQSLIAELASGRATATRKREINLGQLWESYLKRHALSRKKTHRNDEAQWRNHLSAWAARPLGSITRAEVADLHLAIWAANGPAMANRVVAQLSVMFNLAIDWELYAGANPAARAKKARIAARQRVIEAHEFPAFWAALAAETSPSPRTAILLMLLTGQRPLNVLEMRWRDVDLAGALWRLPPTKNGDRQLCPLVPPAVAALEQLPRAGAWVLPGRLPGTHLESVRKAWCRLVAGATVTCPSLADLTVRDLRRTHATWQARTGADLGVTAASLGHRNIETTRRVYAIVRVDEARAAMAAAVLAMQGAATKGS